MWSWLPHHHYHAVTTMATTTMKPKHQCHSAITTPPKTGLRPLSQAQRRRRLPQRRQEVHVDAPPRAQVVQTLLLFYFHILYIRPTTRPVWSSAGPRRARVPLVDAASDPCLGALDPAHFLIFFDQKLERIVFYCHVFSGLFVKNRFIYLMVQLTCRVGLLFILSWNSYTSEKCIMILILYHSISRISNTLKQFLDTK